MKDLGAKAFSYGYACPVLMAATYNDDGTVNVMNLHEVARTNAGHLACCIGKGKKTHENIGKRRAFTLTLANRKLMSEDGKIDTGKIGMIFYESFSNSYYTLGEKVGKAWGEGKVFLK